MAYAIVASKWLEDKRYIEAVLDSADDLAALGDGYAPDSRAIVADGGAAYMTDASGHWQELGSPGGGGGGNPNYVETIEGTLGNPWGGYSASDIFSAALAKDITVYLTIHDNTNKYVLGLAPDADSATRSRRFSCVTAAASTSVGVVVAVYGSTGNLTRCENYSVSSGAAAVIESIESTTPCTLTIIHHPLPDSE